jgi:small subunit ribosomal protein S11
MEKRARHSMGWGEEMEVLIPPVFDCYPSEKKAEYEKLYLALEGLGKKQRTTVILYYFNDLSIKEIAHITASFNNTQCCISDARGNVISWSSSGKAGFKGSRKSTAFAGTMVAQECARVAIAKGMHEVEIRVQGAGAGRESAVRAIATSGMTISVIKDITPVPHNGCRQRKRRRV